MIHMVEGLCGRDRRLIEKDREERERERREGHEREREIGRVK